MNAKSIFTSVTIWGAVLGFLISVFPHAMSYVGITDPAGAAAHLVQVATFLITIYGRIRAKQPLNIFG